MNIKKNLFYIPLVFLFLLLPLEIAGSSSLDHLLDEVIPQKRGSSEDANDKHEGITIEDREEFEDLLEEVLGVSLYEEKQKVSHDVLNYMWNSSSGYHVFRVYATSFGKPGNKGEAGVFKDGSRVRWGIVAAALPDPSVIGKWVEVRRMQENGKRTRWVKMKVKDLGPWFRDDPYWRKSGIPRAVKYFKKRKKRFDNRVVVNPAGIDITPWGWQKLGVHPKKSYNHSEHVEWKFAG